MRMTLKNYNGRKKQIKQPEELTRSSATAEIARDAWNGHSRSLKVIRCFANRRGIYDFLL